MRHLATVAAAALLVVATLWTFAPVAGYGFLNWDDPEVVVDNAALRQPLPALVSWAVTTRHMGHYQPLSWLLFASAGSPPQAGALHTFALVLHALNAALLVWLIVRWLPPAAVEDGRAVVALAAAAWFAVHPLRVEPVAWTSALPYLLSYAALIVAAVAWVDWARTNAPRRWWTAVALVAVSQLSRVTAPLLPLALALVARAVPGAQDRSVGALVRAVLPFAAVVAPLAALEAWARDPAPLSEVGLATRATWLLTQPVAYLWRSVAPGALNPLDAMPRLATPDWDVAIVAVLASIVVVSLTAVLASTRTAWALWGTYGLLLVPVAGLLPSGLQRTADRYTYGPALVLAVALASCLHRVPQGGFRALTLIAAGGVGVASAMSVQAQIPMWRDSVALWSRAVALDADNDVALYNLALAELAAGHTDNAVARLQQLMGRVPDHDLGRQLLTRLVADRETQRGEAFAARRQFVEAVQAFDRALDADAVRTRARLGRGMALVELGRLAPAAADLAAAVDGGEAAPAVVNALAYAHASTGRAADAIALLRRAVRDAPGDTGLTGNLARLLVTADPPTLRDPVEALALAADLNDATRGRDVRVLDTLALALAATGRVREAAEALDVALAIARDAGDRALVAELVRRRGSLTP